MSCLFLYLRKINFRHITDLTHILIPSPEAEQAIPVLLRFRLRCSELRCYHPSEQRIGGFKAKRRR